MFAVHNFLILSIIIGLSTATQYFVYDSNGVLQNQLDNGLTDDEPRPKLNRTQQILDKITKRQKDRSSVIGTEYESPKSFEGFNNRLGVLYPIVPNYVHFLRIDRPYFRYTSAVCLLSVLKNQIPDKIFIHTNKRVQSFVGKHWRKIDMDVKLRNKIVINYVQIPEEIFNQSTKGNPRIIYDFMKLKILAQYGGIFLENDVYVVNNLDRYLHYEMVLPWMGKDLELSHQIIVAHKNARFLHKWIDSFKKHFHPELPNYNAGEYPSSVILGAEPHLIHSEFRSFMVDSRMLMSIYKHQWPMWLRKDVIWLMVDFRTEELKKEIKEFEERETEFYNQFTTFGEIARAVYK